MKMYNSLTETEFWFFIREDLEEFAFNLIESPIENATRFLNEGLTGEFFLEDNFYKYYLDFNGDIIITDCIEQNLIICTFSKDISTVSSLCKGYLAEIIMV